MLLMLRAIGMVIIRFIARSNFLLASLVRDIPLRNQKQDFIAVFEASCANHLKRTGEVVEATFTFVLDDSAL